MYEEKTSKNLQINWKSLLIKLGILLVVIFLIIWIVSLFRNDDEGQSNFGTNIAAMRDAATEYFTGSRLPNDINESTSITLQEMFDRNLLVEFQDENGHDCDTENSYAEATKLDDQNYRIEVRLVCDNESDTIINTVRRDTANDEEEDLDEEEPIIDDENQDEENTSNNSNNNNSQQANGQSTSNNQSSNNQSTSNNQSSNNSSNNTNTIASACTYGNKEYSTVYPLAYVVSGNCAVSASSINGSHANQATSIGNAEYLKLIAEMNELEERTGVNITVNNPKYSKVLNKTGKGYVGYQIYFSAKQVTNVKTRTVYAYYLDQNGKRTVIVDQRNSLNNSNSGSTTINVTSVVLNRSSLTLDVGETYALRATINPSNATNKTVTWSSSNSKVASVSSNGVVTGKSEGTATITAKVGNKTDTVKVTVRDNTYYYCSTDTTRAYSIGYIASSTIDDRRTYNDSYQAVYTNYHDIEIIDVDYGNIVYHDEYLRAYNYFKEKHLSLANGSGSTIDPGNYTTLSSSSLKENNFSVRVTYAGHSGNNYYFNIYRNLYNLNNIYYATPYRYVYYLPLYFDITYIDYDDCETIRSSQVDEYEDRGYILVD